MATGSYALLRKILKALGFSDERADDIIAYIQQLRSEDEETGDEPEPFSYPYRLCDNFLSPAELDFYHVLQPAVSAWAIVCPKVRLGDLFYPQTGDRRERFIARNKVERKHVDFLLCDPQTMRPLLGVELNDSSHRKSKRRRRDEFLARVFAATELPLAWIKVQPRYPAGQLNDHLRKKAGLLPQGDATPATPAATPAPPSPAPPSCPACGAEMILRTARRGDNAGKQFYGCSNFPACREVLAYEAPA
jgi:hypothetical protein